MRTSETSKVDLDSRGSRTAGSYGQYMQSQTDYLGVLCCEGTRREGRDQLWFRNVVDEGAYSTLFMNFIVLTKPPENEGRVIKLNVFAPAMTRWWCLSAS